MCWLLPRSSNASIPHTSNHLLQLLQHVSWASVFVGVVASVASVASVVKK